MKINTRVVAFPLILLLISVIFLLFFNEEGDKQVNVGSEDKQQKEINISEINLNEEDETEEMIIAEDLIKTEEPVFTEKIIEVNDDMKILKPTKQMIVVEVD